MTGPHLILALAQVAAVVAPAVIAAFCFRLVRGGRSRVAGIVAVLGLVAWGLGVWAFLVEPATLRVTRLEIASVAWRGPPVRIGLISDTHAGDPHTDAARVGRVVARTNAEHPDVVLLLGDYVGGHRPRAARSPSEQAQVTAGMAAMAGLRAPLGVFGVLGNHDSWYDEQAVAADLLHAGVVVLQNEAARIHRPAGEFWIAGVADLASRRLRTSIEAALERVPADAPVVLMTHWPDPFARAPERVALTVAGHTHCGQVNLPLVGRPVAASPASRRWPCGLYDVSGRKLFVTGGIGTSVVPVRFGAPPEIVLLTLRSPAAPPSRPRR